MTYSYWMFPIMTTLLVIKVSLNVQQKALYTYLGDALFAHGKDSYIIKERGLNFYRRPIWACHNIFCYPGPPFYG